MPFLIRRNDCGDAFGILTEDAPLNTQRKEAFRPFLPFVWFYAKRSRLFGRRAVATKSSSRVRTTAMPETVPPMAN